VRGRDAASPVWFVGHWGFQFYAERLGMRPLVPDYTTVRQGEWVVVPTRVDAQELAITPAAFELVANVQVASLVPLASTYGIYVGSTPLAHFRGPRVEARVYRARRDSVPPSTWPVDQVADWAMHAGGGQAGWAAHALVRALATSRSPAERALAARALAALGPSARMEPAAWAQLERAAGPEAPAPVREAAALALEALRAPPR
jgi:hypothetical protein